MKYVVVQNFRSYTSLDLPFSTIQIIRQKDQKEHKPGELFYIGAEGTSSGPHWNPYLRVNIEELTD